MKRGTKPKPRGPSEGLPDPIGMRIKELRTARGMSLQNLAERVGVAPSHVFHVENGDKVPGEDLAVEIARVLHEDEDLYRAWARARSRSALRRVLDQSVRPLRIRQKARHEVT